MGHGRVFHLRLQAGIPQQAVDDFAVLPVEEVGVFGSDRQLDRLVPAFHHQLWRAMVAHFQTLADRDPLEERDRVAGCAGQDFHLPPRDKTVGIAQGEITGSCGAVQVHDPGRGDPVGRFGDIDGQQLMLPRNYDTIHLDGEFAVLGGNGYRPFFWNGYFSNGGKIILTPGVRLRKSSIRLARATSR